MLLLSFCMEVLTANGQNSNVTEQVFDFVITIYCYY